MPDLTNTYDFFVFYARNDNAGVRPICIVEVPWMTDKGQLFDQQLAQKLADAHALAIHRRNNLAFTLIMLGKLEEARQMLTANRRLNAPPPANTTPRIAFLRHVISLLESKQDTPFLGQLKNFLTGLEFSVASDVAVPWVIAYFIEFLKSKCGDANTAFLSALVAALNDRPKRPELDQVPEWRGATPQPQE